MTEIQILGCQICYPALFLTLLACSPNSLGRDINVKSNTPAEVRIQICLPTKRIYFNNLKLERLENHPDFTNYSSQQLELAPKTIRRITASNDPKATKIYGIFYGEVHRRSEIMMESGWISIVDSTIANQPIYEQGYGWPAEEYVAINVRLPNEEMGPDGNVTYWFTLPEFIPDDKFTVWLNPIAMVPELPIYGESPFWWKLIRGQDITLYPVSANPPKMRVMLEKQQTEHVDPTTDTLPALTTARQKYQTATSDRQFVHEFVPISSEEIPACD